MDRLDVLEPFYQNTLLTEVALVEGLLCTLCLLCTGFIVCPYVCAG